MFLTIFFRLFILRSLVWKSVLIDLVLSADEGSKIGIRKRNYNIMTNQTSPEFNRHDLEWIPQISWYF